MKENGITPTVLESSRDIVIVLVLGIIVICMVIFALAPSDEVQNPKKILSKLKNREGKLKEKEVKLSGLEKKLKRDFVARAGGS